MLGSASSVISPPTRREFVLILTLSFLFLLLFIPQLSIPAPNSDDSHSVLGRIGSKIPGLGMLGGGGKCTPEEVAAIAAAAANERDQLRLDEQGEGYDEFGRLIGAVKGVGGGVKMRDTLVKWTEKDGAPRTEIVAHAPGWTIFNNIYLLNGVWYLVTDNPSDFPLLRMMTSTGGEIWNDEQSILDREPTDKDLKIIFPSEAKKLFGSSASRVDGTSWMVNDPPQFLDHYYHFAAELLFGLWRTYATLDQSIPPTGETSLPSPRRIMFSHTEAPKWRDYSGMNTFLIKSIFPSMSYEYAQEFKDRTDSARPFVFDRLLFADRAAALRGPQFAHTWRTAAEAFTLPGSPYWWSPVRRNLLDFVGELPESVFAAGDVGLPVITYVSRQEWGRRMLKKEDHEGLVKALNELKEKHGYEVNIVSMDKLTRDEQIRLAARTTIMMGVHGNGLTHLLWMKPTPRATVIEFFYPQGFAHDYEFTSRALGITHFGFWGSEYFTAPDTPEVAYPEGFQGNDIPIDGKVVAELVHARLSIPIADDVDQDIETEFTMDEEKETTSFNEENDPEVMNAPEEAELEGRLAEMEAD